ncbi:MAG: RNA polymerase factor sigma-54, partial [Pseudomonadota bacterium]|nr:RNA polymerase factor sigma-54 [Pseudomonadota bacterium]
MKLSLQLKLGQQLAMTPQLQQAIRLLQLSTLDLQQEIHQALESNPMLELIEGIEEDEDQATDAQTNTESASQAADSPDNKTADNLDEEYWQSEIPKDLEVDSSWDDVYTNSPPPSQNFEADDFNHESQKPAEETLQDHLLWQLNLTPMSESDEAIAIAIIDAIDPNGWLTVDLESILTG